MRTEGIELYKTISSDDLFFGVAFLFLSENLSLMIKPSFLSLIVTFCFFLLECLTMPLSAHFFRHYTINDGLSNNAVYSILQDSKGMMWFGTIDGLHSFDGRRIKVWHNAADSITLGSIIYAIAEDPSGKLWLASDAGVALFDLHTEEFKPFHAITQSGISIHSCVSDVYVDSHQTMWISTTEQGIFYYDLKNKQLTQLTAPNQLSSDRIKHVIEDREGLIWMTTLDNGVCCYNRSSKKFRYYKSPQILQNLVLFEDSRSNLWLGNAGQGLFLLNRHTGQVEQKIKPSSDKDILQIRSILEWSPGVLLLASDEGLLVYEVSTGKVNQIRSSEHSYGGLNDDYLHSLYLDRERGVWIGTYFGGVNYLSPTSGNFTCYNRDNTPIDGKVISAFAKDIHENLWIGTDDAGFFYWNRKTNQFKSYKPQSNNRTPTYRNVHALLPDGDQLYIGMYMGGLDVLDLKTGIFRNYNTDDSPYSLYSSGVYSLYKDKYGELWVGTSQGLNRYNRKRDCFDRIFDVHPADVTCILEDNQGYLWVSSLNKGLFRYDRKKRKWKNYRHVNGETKSLLDDKVLTMSLDHNQRLWIGTDGKGMCQYDYESDGFNVVHFFDPSVRVIFRIIPDHDYLWISTSNGLLKYHPEYQTLKIYNKYDGLQDNQFSPNAGIRMSDGTIYVGGINGFNEFRPAEMVWNNQAPTVVLTDFQLFNKHVNTLTDDTPLSASITYTDRLVLKKQHSIFSLEFAALSYSRALKNRYKYKLDGFEKEWTEITGEPRVTYTNLPPGDYTFRVNASNGDGVWSDNGIVLPIEVLPPFWLSWPFILFYVLVFIGLIFYLFYRMRSQQHKELAYMAAEKDKELYHAKIDFFTHIVHEIRTPLTLILAPLDYVIRATDKRVQDVMPQLNVIERNGKRLLTLVNQLMDFRKMEEGGMEIHCRTTNISRLLEEICRQFMLSAELKQIHIELILPENPCCVNIDPEAFTKIVSNLLSNALKFTSDFIQVKLDYREAECLAELRVTDNGPGISAEDREEIFKPFYQVTENRPTDCIGTGIGLLLVKRLVDLLKGELVLESGVGVGSTFLIRWATTTSYTELCVKETNLSTEPCIDSFVTENEKNRRNILVVDDNLDLQHFLLDLLSQTYDVFCASDGEEALDILMKQTVDLVISDVMMPRMDGFELCRRIKNDLSISHIPVLLLTAKVTSEDKVEGFEIGADVYVDKPFSADVLMMQVNSLLTNRERIRNNCLHLPTTSLTLVANTKVDENFIKRMTDLIEKNLTNSEFTVEVLAQEMCMGRSNFFAKVKGISKMTPNDYIRLIRLKRAAELFMSGQVCISDVCFQVGFSSPSYFSKCFHEQFGVLPTDFLKQLK